MLQHGFLHRILPSLPPPGPFGESQVYFSIGMGTSSRIQEPHNSISSLVTQCNKLSANGFDAYMALASFQSPLGGRKQNNAVACKCLWADIDVGKLNSDGTLKSKYASVKEAGADLIRFADATGLQPTIVVASGKGLHAYWTFSENIPAPVWFQLATFFHQLCIQEGLDVDPTRARDLASVLRLPGTLHQKSSGMVRLVLDTKTDWVPKIFLAQLGRHLKTVPIQMPLPVALPKHTPQQHPLASLMGMGPQPPTADAFKIAQNCRQIESMGLGQYSQWFAAMSVLRRCVDGLKWAHALSSLDAARYDPATCERKFYAAAEDAPARCQTFELENPHVCLACAHRGRIKSPVQLSQMPVSQPPPTPSVEPAAVASVDSNLGAIVGHVPPLKMLDKRTTAYVPLPINYEWKMDQRGIVWIESKKDPGGGYSTHEHVICPVQIWFKYTAHRVIDSRHKTVHYWDALFPDNTTRELMLIADEDMTEQNIMRWLRAADINPSRPAYSGKVFMGFFDAYINMVRGVKKTVPIVKEFGWTKYNDPLARREVDAFVIGNGIITESGVHPVGHDTGTTGIYADDAFTHAGTLEEWKHVPRMYTTLGQKMGEFVIGAALAAPFMNRGEGEAKNAYINLFSNKGGKGKSELTKAAFSIWGNPQRAFGSPNASASQRGVAMSVFNNLPFIVDEITRMKDGDMQDMVYILAGGTDKNRLTSKAELKRTGHWSTVTFSTANRSVKEALSRVTGDTDATLLRVIEYDCDFPDYSGVTPVQNYIRASMNKRDANYGLAGPEFIYQVLKNPVRLERLSATVSAWRLKHGLKDDERFMTTCVGITLEIVKWAVEYGILEFNVAELEAWVLGTLIPFNRASTKELAPDFLDSLSVYLNHRHPNTLSVLREFRGPGEADPRTSTIPDKFVLYRPFGEIFARYEREDEVLKFSSSDFKIWCSQRGISERVLIRDLDRKGIILEKTRANLGDDISWLPTARIRCYVLRKDALRLLGYQPPQPQPYAVDPAVVDPLTSLLMT